MSEKAPLTGFSPTNQGAQEIKAPKQQPKTNGGTVIRGTDLRSGK